VDIFLDNLPEAFKPTFSCNRKRGYRFDEIPGLDMKLNSRLNILTVGGKHKGIGKTLSKLHFTEGSRWENVKGGVGNYIVVATQALPQSVPVTMETTPNGLGHPTYQIWKQAVEGANGFEPIFIPWWYDETAIRIVPEGFKPRGEIECKLIASGASPANIMFRRAKVRELTTAEYDGETMFNQEYPSDPRTCFIAGGKSAFPVGRLLEQERRIDVERDAWLRAGRHFPKTGSLYMGEGGVTWSEQPYGDLTIWEFPLRSDEREEAYVVGADVGKGLETGDYSAGCVVKVSTQEQVAEFHGKPHPDEFGRILARIGYFYNTALIAPERNADGPATIMELAGIGYPSIYQHQKTQTGYVQDTMTLGWHNNSGTRSDAINHARSLIYERNVIIRSKPLIEELQAFVADSQGKYQAPSGGHDDLAWAFMIALWGMSYGNIASNVNWTRANLETPAEEIKRWLKDKSPQDPSFYDDTKSEVAELFL